MHDLAHRIPEPPRQRRRALVLLAVYALFVLVPVAHALLHEAGAPLAGPGGGGGTVIATAACGHGCGHPFHRHHGHLHDAACHLCQAASWWPTVLPGDPAATPAPTAAGRAPESGAERATVGTASAARARAPPTLAG